MGKTIKQNIFNILKYGGSLTTKGDITSDNPEEEKVYTKKINIEKDFTIGNDTLELMSVSLTSTTEYFKDATPNKIRFNLKNRNQQWVNIFINEAPQELIEFVYVNII
jgi:hypothetical protein